VSADGDAKYDVPDRQHALPALLKIDYDGSKLSGTATVWPVTTTAADGRVVADDSKKHVMPLVDPKFDGTTFTFAVFNGEENLLGEMKLADGVFTGRWLSAKSKQSGSLRMVRK
jgi:hypothetical protein